MNTVIDGPLKLYAKEKIQCNIKGPGVTWFCSARDIGHQPHSKC